MTPQEKRSAWRRRKGLPPRPSAQPKPDSVVWVEILAPVEISRREPEPTPEAISMEHELERRRDVARAHALRAARLKRYKRLSLEYRGVEVRR